MTVPSSPRTFRHEGVAVEIHAQRAALGQSAAHAAAVTLCTAVGRHGAARAIFACAPSQNPLLDALTADASLPWDRITVFHMDEYVGLPAAHPACFRHYLREHLVRRVQPLRVEEIAGDATDAEAECHRYAALLHADPIDLVCLGIGENGHLAFNDPPVADFTDVRTVKPVALDAACRAQQVADGCFATLSDVPRHALTLTIPALLRGARLVCCVPGERKAAAVAAALCGPIATSCPASILRRHPAVTLYLDEPSAALLPAGFARP